MIHTTRWRPDTCSCVVEYTWDDEVPADQRTHDLSNVVSKCPAHAALTAPDIYSTVTEENPRKNRALQDCLENGPSGLFDIVDGSRQLKQNISYNFSWSGTAPDRVLTINFTGITLTTPQKNAIQNFLNTKFGSGKVVIV